MPAQTNMPTAAKAAAGVWFALVGFVAAEAYKPLMPPETQFGFFSVVCAGFGFVIGRWVPLRCEPAMRVLLPGVPSFPPQLMQGKPR